MSPASSILQVRRGIMIDILPLLQRDTNGGTLWGGDTLGLLNFGPTLVASDRLASDGRSGRHS